MSLQYWQILSWSWIPRILFGTRAWAKERKVPDIPVELVRHIFSYLPLPSQCLFGVQF